MTTTVGRTLTEHEGQRWILDLLADGKPRTTQEVEHATHAQGYACPDSTARFLSAMRTKGLIKGELSIADKGWRWWKA